jgi:hypothetical protein
MRRKILVLNVVLVVAIAYAGYQLRNGIQSAKARETKMLHATERPAMPPVMPPMPNPPAVLATTYKDVAMKTLFHPSRNPDLPPPAPPPPPPPPPPLPPLPKYYGSFNIGDGPEALLASGNEGSHSVKPGERIGPFTLVDFNTVDITFDWQGQTLRRTLDQLMDRTIATSSASADSGPRSVSTPPPAPVVMQKLGPGTALPGGGATCQANDSTEVGTVQNGLRKVEVATPFGKACRWDPVR